MSGALDRRGFLASLPAVGAVVRSGYAADGAPRGWPATTTPAPTASGVGSRRIDPPARPALGGFGIQLYTLRSVMAEAPDRTLAALAEMGYAEVELAGLYGRAPAEMRAALDAAGLRATSSHVSIDAVRAAWEETLEGAQTLGQALIVVPSLPSTERTAESLRRIADELDRAGEAASRVGIRFGYHNHDWEVRPLADGTVPIDLLLERTDRAIVDWQMDVYWTVHGGAEPERRLRGGRVTSVHVKDRTADGAMVDVGRGEIDWASILNLAESHGLRHAYVEHDRPEDPMETARRSIAHLNLLRGMDE